MTAFSSRGDASSQEEEEEGPLDPAALLGLHFDTNKCKPDTAFVWCLPKDYNQEKHPFTCEYWSACEAINKYRFLT